MKIAAGRHPHRLPLRLVGLQAKVVACGERTCCIRCRLVVRPDSGSLWPPRCARYALLGKVRIRERRFESFAEPVEDECRARRELRGSYVATDVLAELNHDVEIVLGHERSRGGFVSKSQLNRCFGLKGNRLVGSEAIEGTRNAAMQANAVSHLESTGRVRSGCGDLVRKRLEDFFEPKGAGIERERRGRHGVCV